MTDWDARYANDDTPWCKGTAHPMLTELATRELGADFQGRILVPGCGRGWDVLGLADAMPRAEILGIDISPKALATAPQVIQEHPRIRLIQGDFLDPDGLVRTVGKVAAVWEHTCFCAIHPSRRGDYLESVNAILEPGGRLLGLFFLNLDQTEDGPPWNCAPTELSDRFNPAFEIELCESAHTTFPGRHGEEFVVSMRKRQ